MPRCCGMHGRGGTVECGAERGMVLPRREVSALHMHACGISAQPLVGEAHREGGAD